MAEERWKNLEVWRLADELAYQIYQITRHFPKEEIYGLTAQLRKAALSVPTNLVEGYSRKGDKELARFVNIGLGSLAETNYLLYFSHRLTYLHDEQYQELEDAFGRLGQKLWKFYEAVRAF